jgi:hypothetical protein
MGSQDKNWSTNQFGAIAVQPKCMRCPDSSTELTPAFSNPTVKYQEARTLMKYKD